MNILKRWYYFKFREWLRRLGKEKQTCPRRIEEWGSWDRMENLDYWRKDNTCSFCGSLKPEELFKRIDKGIEIGTTTKDYKIYTTNPHGKFYFQHFSKQDKLKFIELMNAKKLKFQGGFGFSILPFFIIKGFSQ